MSTEVEKEQQLTYTPGPARAKNIEDFVTKLKQELDGKEEMKLRIDTHQYALLGILGEPEFVEMWSKLTTAVSEKINTETDPEKEKNLRAFYDSIKPGSEIYNRVWAPAAAALSIRRIQKAGVRYSLTDTVTERADKHGMGGHLSEVSMNLRIFLRENQELQSEFRDFYLKVLEVYQLAKSAEVKIDTDNVHAELSDVTGVL